MKPSNIVLLSMVAVLLSGMYSTNLVLKKEFIKIDLGDPQKNYVSVDSGAFQVLEISGSNGYPIVIEKGTRNDVKVLRRRISFFKKERAGDTLRIHFSGSNMPLDQSMSNQNPVGIIIQCPSVEHVLIKDTYTRLKGFENEQLTLQLEGNAFSDFQNCRFSKLSITAKSRSIFAFTQQNSVDTLALRLTNTSNGFLYKVDYGVLQPTLGDSALVTLSGSSLMEIMK